MTSRQLSIGSVAWMSLMTLAALIPGVSAWFATPIVLVGIILVPGILLALNLSIKPEKLSEYLLYSTGLGLGFLMIAGLGMNWVLPFIGVAHPLAVLPLVAFFDLAVIALAASAYFLHKNEIVSYSVPRTNKMSLFMGILPAVFVIMSACGAQILNNGGAGTVTLIMLFAIAIYAVVLVCLRRSVHEWVYYSALYGISLALLLMYSLRSSHIIGWDINLEYEVFLTTLQDMVWRMSSHPGLDYNACVSLTILPTIFKQLTHISSEYVFKVIFQLLFALTPLVVFAFGRRYLAQGFAFLAAFLLLSQTWFYEQLPALIRQEMAFIFYILLVLALFDRNLPRRARYILLGLFTAAIILSHYSTAYIWIVLVSAVIALSYIGRLFLKRAEGESMKIGPAMFVFSLALIFVWQAVLTGTAGKITKFVMNDNGAGATSTAGVLAGNEVTATTTSGVIGKAVATTLFVDSTSNEQRDTLLAQQNAITRYTDRQFAQYKDAWTSGYIPRAVDERRFLPALVPHFVSVGLGILVQAGRLLLINLMPLIGIIVMAMALYRRRAADQNYDFIVFCLASYGLIVAMIFFPYLQVYYNFTRLYLQMFMVLSVVAMIGAEHLLKYIPRYCLLITALAVSFLFCSFSGALDHIAGGQARITLDQPPSTLDTFYMHDAEISAVDWLVANRDVTYTVHADTVANLRLKAYGNMGSDSSAIFPQTVSPTSYVFMDKINIERGLTYISYGNNLLTYDFPLRFIDDHKDLIYNAGEAKIYK